MLNPAEFIRRKALETLYKTFENIVLTHIKRYKKLEIKDLYKLVYQAAMGPAHIFTGINQIQEDLTEEWLDAGKPLFQEGLMEIIDPRSRVVRVNLRIYRGMGGTISQMANMVHESAMKFRGDFAGLMLYRDYLSKMSREGTIRFKEDDLSLFWEQMEKENFPAVCHSSVYIESYRPAYRVILQELLF